MARRHGGTMRAAHSAATALIDPSTTATTPCCSAAM